MKNILKRIKNSKGYISIETIVVAGLIIGVGVTAIMAFQGKANTLTQNALNKIDLATNSAVVNNPFK